jgi:DNA-binding NarL/FixJ family response regulator
MVVKLIAEGYTNKGISTILSLSIKTTEAQTNASF